MHPSPAHFTHVSLSWPDTYEPAQQDENTSFLAWEDAPTGYEVTGMV